MESGAGEKKIEEVEGSGLGAWDMALTRSKLWLNRLDTTEDIDNAMQHARQNFPAASFFMYVWVAFRWKIRKWVGNRDQVTQHSPVSSSCPV